jgi:hypothetical protein
VEQRRGLSASRSSPTERASSVHRTACAARPSPRPAQARRHARWHRFPGLAAPADRPSTSTRTPMQSSSKPSFRASMRRTSRSCSPMAY